MTTMELLDICLSYCSPYDNPGAFDDYSIMYSYLVSELGSTSRDVDLHPDPACSQASHV